MNQITSETAEMCLLGSCVLDPVKFDMARRIVEPKDFCDPSHALIFVAMLELRDCGGGIDLQTLRDHIALKGIEPLPHLERLEAALRDLPTSENAETYAKAIKQFSLRRETLALLEKARELVSTGQPLVEVLSRIERAQAQGCDDLPPTFSELSKRLKAQVVHPISTGFTLLDENLQGGFIPGRTYIIGAYCGSGKTSLTVFLAAKIAAQNRPVLFISAELSGRAITEKLTPPLLREFQLGTEDSTEKIPVRVDSETRSTAAIERIVEKLTRHYGSAPAVIIDYAQRLFSSTHEVREREVALVGESLQRMANRTGCIVITAAQLNRESQKTGSPKLHHLRESGLLEQIADTVLLLDKKGDRQLIVTVAKNRWGVAGTAFELDVDFENSMFHMIGGPDQLLERLYRDLAEKVCERVEASGGEMKCRDICRTLKFRGSGLTKDHLKEAVRASSGTLILRDGMVVAMSTP